MNTIKFTCVVLLLILLSFTVNAQWKSLGPSVGAGLSMVSNNDEIVDVNPQFLWNAGATFVYSTKNHLGFGADLKYSSEGYKVQFAFFGSTFDINVHLNYLRLPVRVIYCFGDYGGHIRPKIFLGLTPGLLLSAKEDDGTENFDIKDSLSTFDLGAQGGVGVNIRLMEGVWLNTDIGIYQGFLDLGDSDESILNRNVAVNVGVAFGIGNKTKE